ncbi:MAG: hypothetical protein IKW83_08555 [Muribaculaceae bacterium]|nr:hypothetical protein [Muribaculaceae bacterium]
MIKYLLSLIALLACIALLTSCEDNNLENRQVTFTATMPADDLSSSRPGSIINGVPAADGFNLSSRWKDGDKIHIIVRQDDKVYQVESPSTIYDISSDGKTCSFQFTLPKSVKPDRDYDVIGVMGAEVYLYDSNVIGLCTMKRVSTERSNEILLPMWFTAKKDGNKANFRHLCAYEVLYVNNVSDASITFKHSGFDAHTPWYKYNASILLPDGKRGGQEMQSDAESDEITIPAGATGTIVSWYIPNVSVDGVSINNAKLKAVVNGNAVTTTDALKSYKTFTYGSAYYMQVTWDGSTLYFSNEFCPDSNHPHIIDLGLPSGTKWACCNIGAKVPLEHGNYYAWGETVTKPSYTKSGYKWYSGGDDHKITKYCSMSNYGTVDNRTELEPEDDAAYVNWGPEWRMPSGQQIWELLHNTTGQWTNINGTEGYLFKSNTNNRAVFFPAAGWPVGNGGYGGEESGGNYWSRIMFDDEPQNYAVTLGFRNSSMGSLTPALYSRHWGSSVRAVYVGQE